MALRGIEGWDGFGSTINGTPFSDLLAAKWDGTITTSIHMTTNSERYANETVYESTNTNQYWVFELPDDPEEIACGIYVNNNQSGYDRNPNPWLITISYGSYDHIVISFSGRDLLIRFNDASSIGAILIPNVIEPEQWSLIELKSKIHDTTGYWYLYVNGVLVGSETNVDTKYSTYGVDRIRFWASNSYTELGDCYVLDLTGSKNNDVLGAFHIQGILPNANGSDSDWTPSGSPPNYSMVNEAPASDAEYNESGTSTEKDLYNYEDLTGTWDAIYGIQMNTRLLLDSAGSESVVIICDSNGTEDSANFTVDITSVDDGDEGQFRRVFEEDPDTSNDWDVSGINAIQLGVEFI